MTPTAKCGRLDRVDDMAANLSDQRPCKAGAVLRGP